MRSLIIHRLYESFATPHKMGYTDFMEIPRRHIPHHIRIVTNKSSICVIVLSQFSLIRMLFEIFYNVKFVQEMSKDEAIFFVFINAKQEKECNLFNSYKVYYKCMQFVFVRRGNL